MLKNKVRLDIFLFNNGFSSSIGKAKGKILSGWVKVNGETVRTPSKLISGNEKITVGRPAGIFVSRGGEKLNHALKHFGISLIEKTAVDLGASTGGFTDCMLKSGASRVYSIDVGYGQFDYGLRMDKRVVVMERTNVRNLKPGNFDTEIEFVAADLSFISITKVFDTIISLFPFSEYILLIKPQFECSKNQQKKGVVRDKNIHKDILKNVIDILLEKGMNFLGLCYSPIKGPAGNIEFFLNCEINETGSKMKLEYDDIIIKISNVVEMAHEDLN